MAKFIHQACVAFATQTLEGTYNSTLDGLTSTVTAANGLILGDRESGVKESGLDISFARSFRDKAPETSALTATLSDFLRADVPTFTFAFPFCGNRDAAASPPVAADATPIAGIDALLNGAGMTGADSGSDTWKYVFSDSTKPISALVYVSGMRLELLDCRVNLELSFEPGSVPIAEATIAVGSVKEQTVTAFPTTLTFGSQSSVSAPVVENLANQWQDTRGFSEGTLAIDNTIADVPDCNQTDGGIVKEKTARSVTFEGTLFADDADASAWGYEYSQLIEAAEGNLDELSFTVPPAMTATDPAKGVQVKLPKPELQAQTPVALGTKAGNTVTLVARGAAGAGGNDELEIYFV